MGEKLRRPERKPPLSVAVDAGRSILVTRRHGGLGDILMTRPIFHAIKSLSPRCIVTYALPRQYHQALCDVADIDYLACNQEVHPSQWSWHGDISDACLKHEVGYRSKVFLHRTKIWSMHLGLESVDVRTQFVFTQEELTSSASKLRHVCGDRPPMLLTPYSADRKKDLGGRLIQAGVDWARKAGMAPVVLHHKVMPDTPSDVPTITHMTIREWMAAFVHARMVLSTDTAGIHMAGFLGTPACGIFSFTSEKVMCQYYPSVASVQLHRDNVGGLACCPCYDPQSCPYISKQRQTIACIDDLTPEMIVDGLDRAYSMPERDRSWKEGASRFYRGYMGSVAPDAVRKSSLQMPRSILVDLSGAGRVGVIYGAIVASGLTHALPGVPIYAKCDHDQRAELLAAASFINVWSNEPCGARISIQQLIDGTQTMAKIQTLIGTNLAIIGSGIHVDRTVMIEAEGLIPGDGFTLVTDARLAPGEVLPNVSINVQLAIMRRASKIISDSCDVTLLAILSGVPCEHVGEWPEYLKEIASGVKP